MLFCALSPEANPSWASPCPWLCTNPRHSSATGLPGQPYRAMARRLMSSQGSRKAGLAERRNTGASPRKAEGERGRDVPSARAGRAVGHMTVTGPIRRLAATAPLLCNASLQQVSTVAHLIQVSPVQGLPAGGAKCGQLAVTKTEPRAEEGNAGAGGQLERGNSDSRVTRLPSFTMKMSSKMSAHVYFKTPRRPSKTHLSSSPSPLTATAPPTAKPPLSCGGGTRGAVAYLLQVPNPFLLSLLQTSRCQMSPPPGPPLPGNAPCRPRATPHQHRMLRPFLALQPPPLCHPGSFALPDSDQWPCWGPCGAGGTALIPGPAGDSCLSPGPMGKAAIEA